MTFLYTLWLASSQQNMNMMVLLPELALNAGIVILVAHNFDRTVNRGARRRWAEKWFQNADTKIHAPQPSSLSALILKNWESRSFFCEMALRHFFFGKTLNWLAGACKRWWWSDIFGTVISYEVLKITTKRQYTDFLWGDFKTNLEYLPDENFFLKIFSGYKVNIDYWVIF